MARFAWPRPRGQGQTKHQRRYKARLHKTAISLMLALGLAAVYSGLAVVCAEPPQQTRVTRPRPARESSLEGVVVVIFEDSKGVLVSRQGAQWAWGGSAVDPNVNRIRAHSIQPRPDQGQTRPNQGPTSHQWPARSQPWARLAKVQPRVGPTRANQDPSKVRPVTALQGRRGRWTWKVGVEARLGSSVWNVGWQIRLGRSTWPVAWSWPALVCQGRPFLASCQLEVAEPCLAMARLAWPRPRGQGQTKNRRR